MRRLKRVLLVAMALLIVGTAASAAWAWNSGYRIYTVRTGSMEPAIHVGDAVLVRTSTDLPDVGDVITFRPSESAGLVTHRVVGVDAGIVTTKGDANDTDDTWRLDRGMLVGEVHTRLPSLGYVLIFLRQPTGVASVITMVVAICMLWRMCFPLLDSSPRRMMHPFLHFHHPDATTLWTELTDALEAATHALGRHHVPTSSPHVDTHVIEPATRTSMGWSEGTLLDLELLCAQLTVRVEPARG